MRLKNFTNFSDDEIRKIIEFVRPNDITNFDVRISNSKTRIYAGRCYPNGAICHDTANPFIVVRVTRDEKCFPTYTSSKKGKGYIGGFCIWNRKEAVVFLSAHELKLCGKKHTVKKFGVHGGIARE